MTDILPELKDLPTTCLSDAMDGMNNMDSAIKPLQDDYRIAGRAFTVKMPAGDNLMVLKGIREAKPGDVLVIDAKGDTYRAIAGDFVVGMAKTLGIQAIVVDGVIRDIVGIRQLDYPVFSRGTTVAAGGKLGMGEVNVPISCGGVSVHPGDIIVGDADGVLVIPQSKEAEVVQSAKEKLKKDEERENRISGDRQATLDYLDSMLSKLKA
ncbi:RraA family protein [Paenibacillus enshidis]|uniref:Putative 4-hydroxy-4-methyl-2-oxoglutarate aldolase n=1 Tax=Paenibacillus enshidis TaxID=1458439 RepID=A0ABV5AZR6_9BACL